MDDTDLVLDARAERYVREDHQKETGDVRIELVFYLGTGVSVRKK